MASELNEFLNLQKRSCLVMSNTATTAAFLPIVAALAQDLSLQPLALLVPVTMAASCAFMLPAATAPNAIIYADPSIEIKDMLHAGWRLNIAIALLITVYCYWFAS